MDFLDSLLENYCSVNFTPNVVYLSVDITLEKLIEYNYPNYYIRSYGLLGNKTNTDVLKIYDESLHSILLNSLEHKLSRLFLNVSSSTKTLQILPKNTYSKYDFNIFVLHLENITNILNHLSSTVALGLISEHDLKKILNVSTHAPEHFICFTTSKDMLIYKPTLSNSVKD